MNLFKPKMTVNGQEVPIIDSRARDMWREVFTEALRMCIDDSSELLKCHADREYACKLANGAANLADMALAAYENRWAL